MFESNCSNFGGCVVWPQRFGRVERKSRSLSGLCLWLDTWRYWVCDRSTESLPRLCGGHWGRHSLSAGYTGQVYNRVDYRESRSTVVRPVHLLAFPFSLLVFFSSSSLRSSISALFPSHSSHFCSSSSSHSLPFPSVCRNVRSPFNIFPKPLFKSNLI